MTKQELLVKIEHCKSLDEATELAAWLVHLQANQFIPITELVDHFHYALLDIKSLQENKP